MRAALAYASPSLVAALERPWTDRLVRALCGYAARLAGRPVPFGLSAGCASARVEGEPRWLLGTALRTYVRPDVTELERLVGEIPGLPYVASSTAHVAGGKLRVVEREGGRFHPLAVEPDDAVLEALDRAGDGTPLGDIAAAFVGDEVTMEEAYEYVCDLAAAQVLVPAVGPALTADDPAAPLAAYVTAAPADTHVDSSREADVVLGAAVLRDAYRAIEVLHPLGRPSHADADLATFRERFAARYGDREVPLLAALDEETGIGYGAPTALAAAGAPLLAGVNPMPSTDGPVWTPIDHHLVDLLSRAVRTGARELDLGHEDLYPLRTPGQRPLPDALAVRATVMAERLVVHEVSGPSGVPLLSRFSRLDQGIHDLVRAHVAAEEALRPDAVFAEVVHLPTGRSANLAARPPLRAYEIPVLGVPSVPPSHRIALADLRVSVIAGRVVLRSERLDREVLPRITAAHNWQMSALPVYRFLGALQSEGTIGSLRWSWGQVQSAPYLPRVAAGRLVLSRAQWHWYRLDLRPLTNAATAAERYAAVQRLRAEWDVARYVTLATGDAEIPVDLDGVAAAELLCHTARRAGHLVLREQYPEPGDLLLSGERGRYVHEVVLPLVRAVPAAAAPPRTPPGYVTAAPWRAVRIHTGVATADAVLREVVAPAVADAGEWSYVRHAVAPEAYVEVRVPDDARAAALRAAAAPWLAAGSVSDVVVAAYRPEPDVANQHADSVAALRLVAIEDLGARWRAAYHGLARLAATAADPRAFVRARRAVLREMYGDTGDRALRRAGRLWRRERAALAAADPYVAAVLDARAITEVADDEVLARLASAHVNRVLRAAHGVQELVLYDLVDRSYLLP